MPRHDPTSSSDSETSDDLSSRRRRGRHRSDRRSKKESGGDKDSKSRREKKKKSKRDERKEERRRKERRRNRRRRDSGSDSSSSGKDSSSENLAGVERVVVEFLEKFPNAVNELKQLLQMIDEGQAVDTRGISNEYLLKHLKKLFLSLRLNENSRGVFLLPSAAWPTLERIGHLICVHTTNSKHESSPSLNESKPLTLDMDDNRGTDASREEKVVEPHVPENPSTSGKRRIIGPEMPSNELLAAAAKLTEAESELRDAELDVENDLFIGPPPPALVAEAASANEAERFEEVSRIMGAETDSPYDILGVNHNTSADNIKKRYWKLSLLVHPDKCSHPQAHQAFIHLNKAFKELQDPEKKKITDDKIRMKEEQEAFKVELRGMREAAQWRRSQGISMEGDDELLAEPEQPQKREEWMTTLPPERRPGMSMHSTTSFSRTGTEGRGDTSAWTDSPLDKAQKAKMNYLEAYNKAKELEAGENMKPTTDADLVDQYNKSKRSIPLVQKVQEEANSRRKKKKLKDPEKEEWIGQHPWKPWDREKDLVAGRQKVNFDSNSMTEGLTSRFASGTIQRNFL